MNARPGFITVTVWAVLALIWISRHQKRLRAATGFGLGLLMLLAPHDGEGTSVPICKRTNECLWIEGELKMDSPFVTNSQDRRFEAVTDGVLWRARLLNPQTNESVLYWEHGTDGEVVYHATAFNTNFQGTTFEVRKDGTFRTNVGGFRSATTATAVISKTALPTEGDSQMTSLWLAYFSGCHLASMEEAGRSELPPLYATPLEEFGLGQSMPQVAASWALSGAYPHAPTWLVLKGGPTFGMAPNGKINTIPGPRETTNLLFSREGEVSAGGWTVPAKFTVSSFAPGTATAQSPATPKLLFSVKGLTTSIKSIGLTNHFLPALTGRTRVFDHRIHKDRIATYLASNQWPSALEMKNVNMEAIVRSRRERSAPKEGVNALPIFIGVSAVALLALIWISRQKQSKQ